MSKLVPLPAILLASMFATPAQAAQEMKATVTRDETGEFACASRKRVAVLVQAQKDVLPEPRYQYTMGGDLHVLCADYSGTPPSQGKKVRVSLQGDAVQLIQ